VRVCDYSTFDVLYCTSIGLYVFYSTITTHMSYNIKIFNMCSRVIAVSFIHTISIVHVRFKVLTSIFVHILCCPVMLRRYHFYTICNNDGVVIIR